MVSRAHLLALLTVIPLAFSSVISFGSRLERADEELGYLWKHVAHLDSAVDTFDGSFGHNAEIQKAASSVVNAFSKSTLAIREVGRIRRADIDHILSFVEEILPTLNHALGKLGAKKREIDVEGTPVKDLVPSVLLNELRALKTNTVDFAAALVKICPAEMAFRSLTIRDRTRQAVDAVLVVFIIGNDSKFRRPSSGHMYRTK